MRAYLALVRLQARTVMSYRLSLILSQFGTFIQLIVMLAIWNALLGSGRTMAGFDWPHMKAYLMVAFVTSLLVSQSADWRMAERIRNGKVAIDLAKPLDYQTARFAEVVGLAWIELTAGLIGVAGVALVTGAVPVPRALPLVVISVVLTLPLKFLIVYISSLASFYTQNYLGVHWARLAVVSVLSGALVPIAILPGWLQSTAAVLPFAGLASTPALIYTGRASGLHAMSLVGVQAFWVAVLWVAGQLLFRRAVTKVTVHGG